MSFTPTQQILESIKNSENILIAFKQDYTADSVASALALKLWLQKMDKNVDVICHNFRPSNKLKFLPNINDIQGHTSIMNKYIINIDIADNPIEEFSYDIIDDQLKIYLVPKNKKLKYENLKLEPPEYKYDLIITVDTNDLEELGPLYDQNTDLFFEVPVINIDHVADNEQFGQINLVDLTYISSAEIIYNLMSEQDQTLINEDIATCLLTGIIGHTQGFQRFQITPKALNTVSKLIAHGGRREEVNNNLFRTKDLSTLRIWGKVLVNLKYDPTNKLVWSTLNHDDFTATQATTESLPEIIEELITHAPEAKIIMILFEKGKDVYQALVYSEKNIDVLKLTTNLHPQGKKHLCRIELIERSIHVATEKVITEIKNQLKTIPEKNI